LKYRNDIERFSLIVLLFWIEKWKWQANLSCWLLCARFCDL